MPDREALYLFKAARRPLYRQENLQLLGAERGSVVEVAYNRMWVAPEYFAQESIARGTTVFFVFTDRPFELFVPVRQGEVVNVQWDDLMVRVSVVLRSWVAVAGRDLEDFTRLVKRTNRSRAPGNKFLAPKNDGMQLEAFYEEREDEGWKHAIDEILRMSAASSDDPYSSSVFFRPVGLRVGEEAYVARRVPLDRGTRASLLLRFYNPHLGDPAAETHKLRILASDHALQVEAVDAFSLNGDVEVPFTVVGAEPEMTVQIGPTPALHTMLTERFLTKGHGARLATPTADGALPRAVLLALYDCVRRKAVFEDYDDELDLLAKFQRLLPDHQRITERRAMLFAERGDTDEAYPILRELNPDTLGDDARFLLFRLLLNDEKETNPVHHAISLGLTAEVRFARFLEFLEGVEGRVLGRLVPGLVELLPTEQVRDLMTRVGDRLDSPDAIVTTAQNLYYTSGDAPWAYEYLERRRRTLHLSMPEVTDALLELAAAGGRSGPETELAEDAIRRIGNLIERNDLDGARSRLRIAGKGLRRGDRDRLYHRVADRFVEKGMTRQAVEIMAELAYAACDSGDLEDATMAVARARGLAVRGNGDSLEDWLAEVASKVEVAWEKCRPLLEWRSSEQERHQSLLRARYLNRNLLIVGGLRDAAHVEHLEALTGAEVDWAESFHSESSDLDAFVARVRNGHYAAVVHFLQKSGHAVGEKFKPACTTSGVPFLHATSPGRRGLIEALGKKSPAA